MPARSSPRERPGQLKSSVGSGALRVRLRHPEQRPETERLLEQMLGAPVQAGSDPDSVLVRVSDADLATQALAELSRARIVVDDFSLGQPSLDEVFLTLTGHPTAAAAETTEETVA